MDLFKNQGNNQGGQPWRPTQDDIRFMDAKIREVQQNPRGFIGDAFGKDVPQGMNDPRQIVQHLKQSGQLNNRQLQALRRFGI